MSDILMRLKKNYRRLSGQFRAQNVEAWRLYAHDIPSYPYLIDLYKNYAVVYDQGREQDDAQELIDRHYQETNSALVEILQIPEEHIIFKRRERQKGKVQYEVIDPKSHETLEVQEGPLLFEVNLRKYLDTGLFMDHRPLRRHLLRESNHKKVLNLFCYTGALSVAAAKGGATDVMSLDMSNPYLQWARRNFQINDLDYKAHRFQQCDVMAWLNEPVDERWDIILLDPPSFSNSKRMDDVLDVERDHVYMIDSCLTRLNPGGTLYFSTNKRKFKLDEKYNGKAKEISRWTVPPDFADSAIHKAWELHWS